MEIRINDKVGQWTVMSVGETRGYKKFWKVKCDCGIETEVSHYALINNASNGCKRCGLLRSLKTRRKDISKIGDTIHNWTVINIEPFTEKGTTTMITLQCKCGDIYTKRYGCHTRATQCRNCKHKASCGIPNNSSRKGYEELSSTYWSSILIGAKKRNFEVTIDIKYAWDLFIKQNKKCALSKKEICLGYHIVDGEQTASLDRIDSKKGYIDGNVQWVHKQINRIKLELPQEEFIDWCKLVAKYN